MYHIGFDRILVFCVDIPEWKQNNFRKKCGRILKVKLIFNRKSPDLPLSTSVHCVDILFEGVFLFVCLFCPTCFFIFPQHICVDSGEIERISPNFGLRSRYWSIGGASSILFCVGFLSQQTSHTVPCFSDFVPKLRILF